MFSGEAERLTDLERAFLEPVNATHRQYEALGAYFVDKLPSKEAAARFGYTPGSFRVLCHQFRADPARAFFLPERAAAKQASTPVTRRARLREQVTAARKGEPVGLRHRRGVGRGGHPAVPAGDLGHPVRGGFRQAAARSPARQVLGDFRAEDAGQAVMTGARVHRRSRRRRRRRR